jgi:GTPase SAR1 family protein
MSDSGPRKARVAIIGVEGSGKTVLMSVLAHRFDDISRNGLLLNPLDTKTMRYVGQAWNTLCCGQWPMSTAAGQLFELRWEIIARVNGSAGIVTSLFDPAVLSAGANSSNCIMVPICELRFIDAAGQDLRRLFTSDDEAALAMLPAHLQHLWDYCRTADIVVCLVNLKDFLGEGDSNRKLDNEIFVKWALQRLSDNREQKRRMMLVFTQIDQYRKLLAAKGGLRGVANEILPLVYSAHVATHDVSLHKVAAVSDVEFVDDEGGKLQRLPKKGFGSEGLDEFARTIAELARTIRAPSESVGPPPAPDPPSTWVEVVRSRFDAVKGKWDTLTYDQRVGLVIGVGLLMLVIIGCLVSFLQPPSRTSGAGKSIFPKYSWDFNYGTFYDDIWIQNESPFTLHNIELMVTVRVGDEIKQTDPNPLRWPVLEPQEIKRWDNVITIPRNSKPNSVVEFRCQESP